MADESEKLACVMDHWMEALRAARHHRTSEDALLAALQEIADVEVENFAGRNVAVAIKNIALNAIARQKGGT